MHIRHTERIWPRPQRFVGYVVVIDLTWQGLPRAIGGARRELGNRAEEKFRTEEFRVDGEELLRKVKNLINEGNIRRVIIKDKDGKIVFEIPLTFGVVGALIAPQLAAIGAIAALLGEATVVVEKRAV